MDDANHLDSSADEILQEISARLVEGGIRDESASAILSAGVQYRLEKDVTEFSEESVALGRTVAQLGYLTRSVELDRTAEQLPAEWNKVLSDRVATEMKKSQDEDGGSIEVLKIVGVLNTALNSYKVPLNPNPITPETGTPLNGWPPDFRVAIGLTLINSLLGAVDAKAVPESVQEKNQILGLFGLGYMLHVVGEALPEGKLPRARP